MMSGTLALASAIATMDRDTLRELVRQRRPQAAANVSDPIGLATELLRAETLSRVLSQLHRDRLSTLLSIGTPMTESTGDHSAHDHRTVTELTHLGLIGLRDESPVALPEITAALTSGLESAGIDAASLSDALPSATPGDPVPETHTWYASALTALAESSEILRALRDHPGRLNRNGSIAVATVRSLSDTTTVDTTETSLVLAALDRAGLLSHEHVIKRLLPSPDAESWLTLLRDERWLTLAQTTLDSMPEPLRIALSTTGTDLAGAANLLPRMFPLLPATRCAEAEAFVAASDHLGISVQGVLSEPAKRLLAGDASGARDTLSAELPPPAPGIYVQPDLSIVVPGSLTPSDESDLAEFSRPEHIGVAVTRRVSEASLAEAMERGVTASDARELLTRLSMTGIPQPLDYLLGSIAERAGSIRVSEHLGHEGQSKVDVSRRELGETLLIDRSVQHLQLTRNLEDQQALYSKLRPEHVVAALNSAHYPASLSSSRPPVRSEVDPSGRPASQLATRRQASASAVPHCAGQLSPELESLVDRVFLAARSEPGTGDFTRLLELAIRDRGTVEVTAEARGQTHVFRLLPVSLSNGRLRATDTSAGMERTLPVGMITSVKTL